MSSAPERSDATLLLVEGTGRSGTSTLAGSLARLGYVIPQPEIPADDSNPRGFFEPRWVVDFHKRILDEMRVRTNDPRPKAARLAAEAARRPDLVEELTTWLASQRMNGDLVVKDPRTFWMHAAWRRATEANDIPMSVLTMLRPPAEVVRSRDQHYLADKDPELRRARQSTSVAGWCHGILVTERLTRGDRRAFVLYHELMADWRTALARADHQIGTRILTGVGASHHPVDDFIDSSLNRSSGTWDGTGIHPDLTTLADQVWSVVCRLVAEPNDDSAHVELDELSEHYDALYTFASDLTLEETKMVAEEHRRKLRAARERSQRLSEELAAARRSLSRRVIDRLRRN